MSKTALENIKQNAQIAKQTIDGLKNELNALNKEYNTMLTRQLQEENAKLLAAVENAKKKLIQLEVENGITQVPIPKQTIICSSVTESPKTELNSSTKTEDIKSQEGDIKVKKEKKDKKPKEPKEVKSELPVDVGRLDLRIGKVVDIQLHPDADTLYVLKINVGEENPRTVCSGLVKHIPIDDLKDKTLVVLCNLKPVKMRGITSEAMVMCASSEKGVETIIPPLGCTPGDLVHCDGYTRQADQPFMNPKKKIFETIAPELHTNDNLQACYKGTPFQVLDKGFCVSKTLKNVPVK